MAAAIDDRGFFCAFRNAVQVALESKFSDIVALKPVQEEALLAFLKRKDVLAVLPTSCGKSLIFQLVPAICANLHDQGFDYPKNAVLLVICPLTALIDSHIQELADRGIAACSLGDDSEDASPCLQTGNPRTADNRAAMFCFFAFSP